MGAQLPSFSRYVLIDQLMNQSGFLSGLSNAAKTAASLLERVVYCVGRLVKCQHRNANRQYCSNKSLQCGCCSVT